MAVVFASQSACYPWAYSITFGPTLTGTWVGELMPAVGGTHIVFVDLHSQIGEDAGDDLSGNAALCADDDETRHYGVTGSTSNWRGTRFWLTTYIIEHREGQGVQLGRSEGEWDREDSLTITAHLVLMRIRNGGAFSSTDRSPEQITLEDTPVTLTMRRSSKQEFEAACRALRGRLRRP